MTSIARIASLLSVALVLSACGGGDDSSGTPSDTSNNPPGGQSNTPAPSGDETQSLNWAGYVQSGLPTTFTSISGSWIVPDLNCSGDANSSTWIGIGGGVTQDPTLIQAGTEQDCSGSDKSFHAWWEALPAPQVPADGFLLVTGDYPVNPGDQIRVTIGSTLVVWTIAIVNATQGWTFNQTIPYLAAGDTAEWIEEAPLSAGTGGAGQMALANFGTVQFTGLTVNGANPALQLSQRSEMVDQSGNVLASPSVPGDGGDSFRVCWGSGGC